MKPFSRLVHRRLVPALLSVCMAASGVLAALSPMPVLAAAKAGKVRGPARGHIAMDLHDEL